MITVSNKLGEEGFKTTYSYDNAEGIIKKVSSTDGSDTFEKTYNIDDLGRITSYLYNTEKNNTVSFTYHAGAGTGTTTTLVKTMKVGDVTYEYTYDDYGNITKVTKNGSEIQSYTYDSLNQLTRENNAETKETVVYTYDNHGNILTKTVYPYNNVSTTGKTTTYGYDSSWTDLLTSYDGQTITYDEIGNPLNYRDGFSFKWSGGRKLTSVKLDNGSVYMRGEYRYDDNGIRVYKEVNGNSTKFYLDGSTILTEVTNYGGTTRRVDYVYDENGSVYGFSVNGESYYYQKNLQGDVIGILDSSGNLLVSYTYTAFGVPTVSFPGITSSMTASQKKEIYVLGSNNPFRYRGYYFDTETGFYYLNSRYYDPVTGRFLNADAVLDTSVIIGYDMFTYCGNNPVNRADHSGHCSYDVINGFVCQYEEYTKQYCGGCADTYNCAICNKRMQYNLCYYKYKETSKAIATRWIETATGTYNTITQKKEEIETKKAEYIKENPILIVPEVLYHALSITNAYTTFVKGAAWVTPKAAKGIYKAANKIAEVVINVDNFRKLCKEIKTAKEEMILIFGE